jgi:hypothetical protein
VRIRWAEEEEEEEERGEWGEEEKSGVEKEG